MDPHTPESVRLIGGLGGQHLAEALARQNPAAVLDTFHSANQLAFPSITPALALLHIHDVTRATVHRAVLRRLSTALRERMASASQQTLDALIAQAFPFVETIELQELVFDLLKQHHAIPPTYIDALAANADLYAASPIEVLLCMALSTCNAAHA